MIDSDEVRDLVLARRAANIARVTALVDDENVAADRLDALAATETVRLVADTLKEAATNLRSQARADEKWLEDLRSRERRAET